MLPVEVTELIVSKIAQYYHCREKKVVLVFYWFPESENSDDDEEDFEGECFLALHL